MSDPRKVFSENIKRYMEDAGIDQIMIAEKLNVSTSTVSDWVTGKKYPRPDAMQRVADLLGIMISDLQQEEGKRSEAAVITTEEERNLLNLFRMVPEDGREFVLDVIRAALKNRK